MATVGTLAPLSEQVAVVMGASSGVGRATALRLAERGARVVVAARDRGELEALADHITRRGGSALAVAADVTERTAVAAVADAAADRFGGLDTWVHIAGVGLFATFDETTVEEFAQVLQVNTMGQVHGAKAALPHLRRRGRGAFVAMSSMGAVRAIPLQTAYCASKHAVEGFVEALRVELAAEGVPISVTSIKPATLNTPFFDKARQKLGVRPTAPPPVYDPTLAADAIVHAAEHPVRDVVVGGGAQALINAQRLSPDFVDGVLSRVGIPIHLTDTAKAPDAPDNLFGHVPGHDTVQGSLGDGAVRSRLSLLGELNPLLRQAGATARVAGRFVAPWWPRHPQQRTVRR